MNNSTIKKSMNTIQYIYNMYRVYIQCIEIFIKRSIKEIIFKIYLKL